MSFVAQKSFTPPARTWVRSLRFSDEICRWVAVFRWCIPCPSLQSTLAATRTNNCCTVSHHAVKASHRVRSATTPKESRAVRSRTLNLRHHHHHPASIIHYPSGAHNASSTGATEARGDQRTQLHNRLALHFLNRPIQTWHSTERWGPVTRHVTQARVLRVAAASVGGVRTQHATPRYTMILRRATKKFTSLPMSLNLAESLATSRLLYVTVMVGNHATILGMQSHVHVN